jgi:hypothetical protein
VTEKTEAGKGSPKKPALEKTTGKGDLMDAVCRGERHFTGKGGFISAGCQKAWAQAKAVEARGERYLKVSESEAEAGRNDWSGFCEQVEAEGLEAVGHFYVPCEDAKLRGLIDGRIITAPPVSAAKAEIDSFLANAGRAFDWAVKRLKQADPRIIVVVKRKNEDETDGEYLIRRRRETHVAALGLKQPKSGSRGSAEESDGEEKASSSEGAGGIVGEGGKITYEKRTAKGARVFATLTQEVWKAPEWYKGKVTDEDEIARIKLASPNMAFPKGNEDVIGKSAVVTGNFTAGSRGSAEESDGEEKASSSEGAGGIVGEGPRSRYPAGPGLMYPSFSG